MRWIIVVALGGLVLAGCGSPAAPTTAAEPGAGTVSTSTYHGVTCADTDMIRDQESLVSQTDTAESNSPQEALAAYFAQEPALRGLDVRAFDVVRSDAAQAILVARRDGRSVARVELAHGGQRWHVERSVMCQSYVNAARG